MEPEVLALDLLAILFLAGFVVYYVRFWRAERLAKGGDPAVIRKYNRMLRGFPNGFYAKMLGRRPLDRSAAPETKAK